MRSFQVGTPEPGYYLTEKPGLPKARLLQDRIWVTASIYYACPLDPFYGWPMQRPKVLLAELDGEPIDVWSLWPWIARFPITQAEYCKRRDQP